VLKVGPLAQGKKRIKLTLDTLIYQAFKLFCKNKHIQPSRLIEAFMWACLKNPALPQIIFKLTKRGYKNGNVED